MRFCLYHKIAQYRIRNEADSKVPDHYHVERPFFTCHVEQPFFTCHVERPTGVETSLYTSALKISPLTSFGRNDKWSDRFSCHVERPTGVETSSYMSVLKISPLTSFGRNDKARQARPVTQFSIMLSYGRPARRSSHLPWEAGREQTSTVSNRIGKFLA